MQNIDPIVQEDIQSIMAQCRKELSDLSGKTIMITGGSGFVGSYLVETIMAFNANNTDAPCHVLLPTRSIEKVREKWPHFMCAPHMTWFEWNGAELRPPIDSCDYLIHSASPADPADYLLDPFTAMDSIVTSTKAVISFSERMKIRSFLYLSSGAVYGRSSDCTDTIPEDYQLAPDLTDPRSCYGEAKRYSELLCQLSTIPVVIARLFAFHGPYQDLSGSFALPNFIHQAIHTGLIHIKSDGSAKRSYCYAADLATGLWKLLLRGEVGKVYNVGADKPVVSILQLANMIAEIVGNVEVVVDGEIDAGNGKQFRYVPDIGRFSELHVPKVSLRDGLKRTLESICMREQISLPFANG